MITLRVTLDELDYDALLDQYLPVLTEQLRASGNPVGMLLSNGMPAGMAKTILHGLSQEQKDKLAADLINGNREKLTRKLQEIADKQNISVTVKSVQAEQQ